MTWPCCIFLFHKPFGAHRKDILEQIIIIIIIIMTIQWNVFKNPKALAWFGGRPLETHWRPALICPTMADKSCPHGLKGIHGQGGIVWHLAQFGGHFAGMIKAGHTPYNLIVDELKLCNAKD